MPKLGENCHVFYRLFDGRTNDVSFGERAQFTTPERMASIFGGDGTLLGSAQAFYDSLDKVAADEDDVKNKVKDKRMVFFWAEKDGVANVHETLAHSAVEGWETLPAEAAVGYYACKHPDMGSAPNWPQDGAGWLQEKQDAAGAVPPPLRKPAGRPPSTVWTTNNPY